MTVMIQWSWRLERLRSIEGGSWSEDARMDRLIASLRRNRVSAVTISGRIPELVVTLSGSRWLNSFMTAEGQPQWTVFLTDGSWLTVDRGAVIHDTQNQRRGGRETRGAT